MFFLDATRFSLRVPASISNVIIGLHGPLLVVAVAAAAAAKRSSSPHRPCLKLQSITTRRRLSSRNLSVIQVAPPRLWPLSPSFSFRGQTISDESGYNADAAQEAPSSQATELV